jgi:1,4-dihydroxy-2-naphthoyl-CoA hydrolase
MSDLAATRVVREAMPYCATLGVRAERYAPEEVALALDWAPGLCTTNGILHGGVIMSLADAAGGACAMLSLPDGASGTTTIESKTNFLGAVRSGTVR